MNELKLPSTTFQSYWGGEYRSIRCRLHRVHIVIDGNQTRHFNPAMHLSGFHSQKVEEESKKKKKKIQTQAYHCTQYTSKMIK
jgi:hypothetical protein